MKKILLYWIIALLLCNFGVAANSWDTANWKSYWSHDDADVSGTISIDSKETENGTIVDTTTGGTGIVNQDFSFNGTDKVTFADNSVYRPVSDFSAGCWIKPVGELNGAHCLNSNIVGGSYGWGIILQTSPQTLDFRLNTNGADVVQSNTLWANGKWHHVVVVHDDSANNISIYINGTHDKSATVGTPQYNAANPLAMGYRPSNNDQYLSGELDECFFYTEALNSTQILDIFNQGKEGLRLYDAGVIPTTQPTIESVLLTSVLIPEYIYNLTNTYTQSTADRTPTFTLVTDINSNCSISDTNSSYAICGSTGTTSHTCTINTTQQLINTGYDNFYFNCTDVTGLNITTNEYPIFVDSVPPTILFDSPVSGNYPFVTELDIKTTPADNVGLTNITMSVNGTIKTINTSYSDTALNNTQWITNLTGIYNINYTVQFNAIQNVSNSIEYLNTNSSLRWYFFSNFSNITTNLTLNGFNRNITAELGSTIQAVANSTIGIVSLIIEHPEYKNIIINGSSGLIYNFSIDYFRTLQDNFNRTIFNITNNNDFVINYFYDGIKANETGWNNWSMINDNNTETFGYANSTGIITTLYIFNTPKGTDNDSFIEAKYGNSSSVMKNISIGSGCISDNKMIIWAQSQNYGGGSGVSALYCGGLLDGGLHNGFNFYELRPHYSIKTAKIPAHEYDEVINLSFNLTGYENDGAFPNLNIYLENVLVYEGLALGGQLTVFNDSSTNKTGIWLTDDFKTVGYVVLPKNANATTAFIDVLGTKANDYIEQQNANSTLYNSFWTSGEPVLEYDNDWLTYEYDPTGSREFGVPSITHTYNPPVNSTNLSYWEIKGSGFGRNNMSMINCFNGSVNTMLINSYRFIGRTYVAYNEWYCNGLLIKRSNTEANIYEDSVHWYVTNITYPREVEFHFGENNGTPDFNYSVEFNLSLPITSNNFASKVNQVLKTCSEDGFGNCIIPLYVSNTGAGRVTLSNINITYTFNPNPISINKTILQDYLLNTKGKTTLPIRIDILNQKGIVEMSDIKYDYAGGNKTYKIISSYISSNVNLSHYVTYYFSNWDSSLPNNVDYIEYMPNTPTDKNVTPFGQKLTRPIMNFTSQNYGGKTFNFTILINDSNTCINDTVSLTNNKSEGKLLVANKWINFTDNIDYEDSFDMYSWADLQCTGLYWDWWAPYYYFRACCTGCDVCSDDINSVVII